MKNVWKIFWGSVLFIAFYIVVIVLLGYRMDAVQLLPDTGAGWYYWKLPVRSFWPMFTAWGLYALHQVSFWALIYSLQFGDPKKRFSRNLQLLTLNGIFMILHLAQSHIWYDGLAQDTPVMSSQGSVIVMLVLILIIEMDRRGLVLGKKLKGFERVKAYIKRYHGYYIAWAITFTFWFHPTINTPGHLFGFAYMGLLFLQGSMGYTKVHMNKYWRFILEVLVLAHGTTVAIIQGNGMWPMFAFGFGLLAVLTQLYGLGLKKAHRISLQILYFVGVLLVYGGFTSLKNPADVHQITWIPIVEYGLVFVFLFVGEGLLRLFGKKGT